MGRVFSPVLSFSLLLKKGLLYVNCSSWRQLAGTAVWYAVAANNMCHGLALWNVGEFGVWADRIELKY